MRKGSCWLEVRNGQCENNIKSLVTKSECCGSIGKAWGSPCEECPLQCKYEVLSYVVLSTEELNIFFSSG